MTPKEAVLEIIYEARSERSSTTKAKRVLRACRVLKLDDAAIVEIMQRLEIAKHDGTPWSDKVAQVWRIPETVGRIGP
jgi:hypothetical protein